jgi:hypothetical protein
MFGQKQKFSYMDYDTEWDIKRTVSKQKMTVEKFKLERKIKTGFWNDSKNNILQTYKIEVYDPDTKTWSWMFDPDIIDFSKCPRIKVQLISV